MRQLRSHSPGLWSSLIKKKRDMSIFRTHKHIYNVTLSVMFEKEWNLSLILFYHE
jgi:hypothetical protein